MVDGIVIDLGGLTGNDPMHFGPPQEDKMTKGFVGDVKAIEERKSRETVFVEEHKKHNHQLTRQARIARREKHKQHTMEKHMGKAP